MLYKYHCLCPSSSFPGAHHNLSVMSLYQLSLLFIDISCRHMHQQSHAVLLLLLCRQQFVAGCMCAILLS